MVYFVTGNPVPWNGRGAGSTCSPTPSSPSTPTRASTAGTSSRCTTTSGTTTCPNPPFSFERGQRCAAQGGRRVRQDRMGLHPRPCHRPPALRVAAPGGIREKKVPQDRYSETWKTQPHVNGTPYVKQCSTRKDWRKPAPTGSSTRSAASSRHTTRAVLRLAPERVGRRPTGRRRATAPRRSTRTSARPRVRLRARRDSEAAHRSAAGADPRGPRRQLRRRGDGEDDGRVRGRGHAGPLHRVEEGVGGAVLQRLVQHGRRPRLRRSDSGDAPRLQHRDGRPALAVAEGHRRDHQCAGDDLQRERQAVRRRPRPRDQGQRRVYAYTLP